MFSENLALPIGMENYRVMKDDMETALPCKGRTANGPVSWLISCDSRSETFNNRSSQSSFAQVRNLYTIPISTLIPFRLFETWEVLRVCRVDRIDNLEETAPSLGSTFQVRIRLS